MSPLTLQGCTGAGSRNRGVLLWTLLILAISLGATVWVFRYRWQEAEIMMRRDFSDECHSLARTLEARIEHLKQILRGGVGMVSACQPVSRENWRTFYERQQLKKTLPGIQGLGLSVIIPPDQLQQHTATVQAEGYPNYRVWPEGQRSIYSAIVYLEPFDVRNQRAFGYDMFAEPVRHAAMQSACDQNTANLTGPVKLAQEDGKDLQVGTLMYVPVYQIGKRIETVAERRAALVGWVYSPYRMDDLVRSTLEHSKHTLKHELRLQIFDGASGEPADLMFDSHRGPEQQPENETQLAHTINIDAAGRTWMLRFQSNSSLFAENYFALAWLSLSGGGLLSSLITGLIFAILNTKSKAKTMAERLTADLKQSEERWKFATEGSNIGVWDWEIRSNQLALSRSWKEMLGYAEEEIASNSTEWTSRVFPADLAMTMGKVEAYLQGKTSSYDCEFRMRTKDGSLKWIRARGLVVKWDEAQRPLRMVGTHTDITLEKNYAKELAEMLERQQQISRMKSRFISITSHEFRTPLAAAMAAAELLNKHAESIPSEKRRELLTRIAVSIKRMAELLDEVLTLNRIEEDQLKPRPVAVDLRPLVEGMIEEIVLADQGAHAIELSAPASVPTTLDPTFIRKILSNLLSNAVRYSPAGTSVKVRIELASATVLIVVEDQGIGVPAKDLKRIFEPFERCSNVGEIKGTGLGLSIVKRMTELLHGSVEIESVEGQGTRFTINLPVHHVQADNKS